MSGSVLQFWTCEKVCDLIHLDLFPSMLNHEDLAVPKRDLGLSCQYTVHVPAGMMKRERRKVTASIHPAKAFEDQFFHNVWASLTMVNIVNTTAQTDYWSLCHMKSFRCFETPQINMRILENVCMLLLKALRRRAAKDTMALLAHSIGGTNGVTRLTKLGITKGYTRYTCDSHVYQYPFVMPQCPSGLQD